jgi:hypothetical protein
MYSTRQVTAPMADRDAGPVHLDFYWPIAIALGVDRIEAKEIVVIQVTHQAFELVINIVSPNNEAP